MLLQIHTETLLKNITCKEHSYWSDPVPTYELKDILTLLLFSSLHFFSIIFNSIWILVLYRKTYIILLNSTTRLVLLILCYHGILLGLLVICTSMYTLLTKCWPFGSFLCKIQAVVHGGLSHHYVSLIIIIAVDSYWIINCDSRVNRFIMEKNITTCLIILSLIGSFGLYWYLVFILQSFKVSTSSFEICQAVHLSERMRIISLCIYYFMPTLIFMYCYGYIFHHRHIDKLNNERKSVDDEGKEEESLSMNQRISQYKISKLTAVMSLIFNIAITPYTMKEVLITIGGSKPSVFWDLFISWFGESYSLFNPLVSWCMDSHLRQLTKEVIQEDILCRRSSKSIPCCANNPSEVTFNSYKSKEVPKSRLDKKELFTSKEANKLKSSFEYPLVNNRKSTKPTCYIENGEKHWGEILEKSLSVRSIHHWNHQEGVSSFLLNEKAKLQSISLNHLENS